MQTGRAAVCPTSVNRTVLSVCCGTALRYAATGGGRSGRQNAPKNRCAGKKEAPCGLWGFMGLHAMLLWRRGRDLNPRKAHTFNGFQDRRDQPLCHPSAGCALLALNKLVMYSVLKFNRTFPGWRLWQAHEKRRRALPGGCGWTCSGSFAACSLHSI